MLLLSNRIKCAGLLGFFGLLASSSFAGGPHGAAKVKQLSVPSVQKKLNQASARFIQNSGQWSEKALFLARSENLNVWLTRKGVTFDYFKQQVGQKHSDRKGQVITMSFKGAAALAPVGTGNLGFKTNYLKGNGKLQHAAGNFTGAVAKNVYPGVALHSYYDHEKPRYDLVVSAKADPSVIRLAFHGADRTSVSGNTIQLSTNLGTLSQGKLVAYQMVGGKKRLVAAQFTELGKNEFGFRLGAYDHSKELVIDPLVYGSYYGGDGGFDSVNDVATDNAGGVYLTGYTLAPDFPNTDGPYGFSIHGGKDAFVAKLQGDAYNEDYSAYIGGSLDDNSQYVAVDPFGNVWIAGRTQSSDFPGNEVYQRPNVQFMMPTSSPPLDFPPTGGTFEITYGGGIATTAALPFNATGQQIQIALNNALPSGGGQITVTPPAAQLSAGAQIRISLPWNLPLLLSVVNSTMPTSYVCRQRSFMQAVELAATAGVNPTGGTYALDFVGFGTTPPIAYNAPPAVVIQAIDAALGNGSVNVLPENPTAIVPPYVIEFIGQPYKGNPPAVTVITGGLTGGVYQTNDTTRYGISWDQTTSFPVGGSFQLLVTIGANQAVTPPIAWNANNVAIRTALTGLTIVGANNVVTDVEPLGGVITLPEVVETVTFCGALINSGVQLQIITGGLHPQPTYGFATHTTDIFVMRFKQSSTTVLDPTTVETVRFFGGDGNETLAAFSIMPQANPLPTDPVIFAFGGTVVTPVPELPNFNNTQEGFIARYVYKGDGPEATQFMLDPVVSRYIPGGNGIDLTGVAVDSQGSVYTGGTIHFNGNFDTSVVGNSVFTTTSGVFPNGQLLRNDDLFVQKYVATGTAATALAYSALIGGNDYDHAGGLDFDLDGSQFNAGNSIAVDQNLNLYICGVSGSFDFPRTRGVYGQVFTNFANVTVTKINSDASQILYSTNLNTAGLVNPAGIAIDPRGDAFITGNVHPDYFQFPDTYTFNPMNAGNPNVPTNMPLGTIQVTPDALVPTNLQPTQGVATVKGFLNILDPAADSLLYGTYLGGALDDRVFGPYVDSFGDVWVFGWETNYRDYFLFDSSGNPHEYLENNSTTDWLPLAMISPLAFKSVPDIHGNTEIGDVAYGSLSPTYPNYTPWSWTPSSTSPGFPIASIGVVYRMDGWLDKLRVGLASVQSLTLAPTTIPGGLGATTTGTVTLTQAAPAGGADIVLTLLNSTTAASFSSIAAQSSLVITIPGGATTGTFTVYSDPVTSNTSVQVQASYQGSFQIGLFTVTPWLQQLSLTPTSVVGGNAVTGRITLAANPPTGSGGVNVTVLTDDPNLITFPGGATVNVPEGQSSVTFTINTAGVGVVSFPTITASLLGVGITETETLTLAALSTLSFNPPSVAGGTPSTATLALNGQATGPFVVNLTTANSAFSFADIKTGLPITQLTFNTGDSAKSFTVLTPYEPSNTQDVITATVPAQGNYPPQSISATLFVTAVNVTGLTISPTSPVPGVNGGSVAVGTVTINSAASTGGVVCNLASSNTAYATVPPTVTIPAGATSATFKIQTSVVPQQSQVVISASRGPVSATSTMTINAVTFNVSLSTYSTVGGLSGSVTGTITLAAPAASGGLTFVVTLPPAEAQYAYFGGTPGTSTTNVLIPGGGTTGTFIINTAVVPTTQEIPIFVYVLGGTPPPTPQVTLEVRVVGVKSISFVPSTIRGNNLQQTFLTITLDAPAPKGGTVVTLTQSEPLLHLAASYTVPAGATTLQVPQGITALGVSRSLADIVTATPPNGGGTATAVVVITR